MSDAPFHCPRCRYDLRAATTPICPECGLEVDAAEVRAWLWRANTPAAFDRADLWQPHLLLVLPLWELLTGAMRPRRRLAWLDVNGSLLRGVLAFVIGAAWLWVLGSSVIALSAVNQRYASPGFAIRATLPEAGLRITAGGLVAAVAAFPLVLALSRARNSVRTARHGLRLLCYWAPAAAVYFVLPVSILWLLSPELAASSQPQCVMAFATVMLVLAIDRSGRARAGEVAFGGLIFLTGLLAAYALLPRSIAPPVSGLF